jgi:hypothetical protein
LWQGDEAVPSVTILFAIFGIMTIADDMLALNWARRPSATRVAINLGWLAAAFTIRHCIVASL